MRFEETNHVFRTRGIGTGCAELARVFSEFLESGIQVAELKDWQEYYKTPIAVQSSAYTVIKRFFNGQIRLGRSGGKVYIERL